MAASRTMPILPLLRAMRPVQWVKNAVVVAPLFFAYGDPAQGLAQPGRLCHAATRSLAAAVVFCLVCSGVYLFNDILDRREDAAHPVKRFRPIASGEVPVRLASFAAAILAAAGLAAAFALPFPFGALVALYLLMQLVYTLALKRVALLDVVIVAAGFVLRAVAGAVAIRVAISPWLVLCTFFLSLFLALCKRRHEKTARSAEQQRSAMKGYSARLLDMLVAISATLAILAYSLYAISAETVAKFGSSRIALTIPFVVFGIFRYIWLVFRRDQGERPEKTLLTDWAILASVALFLLAFATILVLR